MIVRPAVTAGVGIQGREWAMGYRVLVADDEPAIQQAVGLVLRREVYDVTVAGSGTEALRYFETYPLDLIILDFDLGDINGLDVCRRIRHQSDVPILLLSGRSDESIKISAFDSGADDFVTKPFRPNELRARVRALIRRRSTLMPSDGVLQTGSLDLDFRTRSVRTPTKITQLTRTEFAILVELAKRPGTVFRATDLARSLWGAAVDRDQCLRVHIGNLRKKLEVNSADPEYIHTVTAVGYRLAYAIDRIPVS